jgi:hypothetical protein
MKFNRVDILLIAGVAAIFYFRNWQAILFFVVVFAYAALRNYKAKKGEPPADSNEFLIEKEDETLFTAELDIGLDYRSKPIIITSEPTTGSTRVRGNASTSTGWNRPTCCAV